MRASGWHSGREQASTDSRAEQVNPDTAAHAVEDLTIHLADLGSSFWRGERTIDFTARRGALRTFEAMNEVYRELIPEPRPGRSTAEAKLALPEILVEIEAIALAG
jgi:enamine deaminase RidA (YjgF/YER057c/UK114 family)